MTSAVDGRRVRGNRTRAAILGVAVGLATERGLDGFSIGDLAAECGLGKASIAAAFGGKADLQRAIVDRARETLARRVFDVVFTAPAGLARLERLGGAWFDYLSDPDLRGGCFFAAALFEFDSRPGSLQSLVSRDVDGWLSGIAAMIVRGQSLGEIDPGVDADVEALEFFTLGVTTNSLIQLRRGDDPAGRARRAWANHINRIRTSPDGRL